MSAEPRKWRILRGFPGEKEHGPASLWRATYSRVQGDGRGECPTACTFLISLRGWEACFFTCCFPSVYFTGIWGKKPNNTKQHKLEFLNNGQEGSPGFPFLAKCQRRQGVEHLLWWWWGSGEKKWNNMRHGLYYQEHVVCLEEKNISTHLFKTLITYN